LRALIDNEKENEDEDEVFDNDEINEIIARDDNELKLFKSIDSEREKEDQERWKKSFPLGTSIPPFPPSLISYEEIPKIYLHDENNEVMEIEDPGLSTRKRKQVVYDDGLTDEQWVEKLEKSEDESVSTTRKRKKKVVSEEESSFEESGEEDVENKRQKDESGIERIETIEAIDLNDLKRMLSETLEVLKSMKDEEGRVICALFLDLPDRSEYPDYYQKIKKPISINMIQEKVDNDEYMNLESFSKDLNQMFSNAFKYNMKGSWVYEDAQTMKREFANLLARMEKELY
jgi:ATP-dependent helicase STH1/SNF2